MKWDWRDPKLQYCETAQTHAALLHFPSLRCFGGTEGNFKTEKKINQELYAHNYDDPPIILHSFIPLFPLSDPLFILPAFFFTYFESTFLQHLLPILFVLNFVHKSKCFIGRKAGANR